MNKTLLELVDNSKTDKNTCHSYLDTYESLFFSKKNNPNNILEIGIGEPYHDNRNGGSIKLWRDYFMNSTIYGIDIHDISKINSDIINQERINLLTGQNAYDLSFIKENFIDKNITFDILIDDGPHTLDSMIFFIQNYINLLNKNGLMIVEDVQSMDWIQHLINAIPANLNDKINYETFDLRNNKRRWDDILFVIRKI